MPWVILATMIVAVPTAFTVMAPETARWSAPARFLVLVVWLPIVALAAWFARRREERSDEFTDLLWPTDSDQEEEASVEDWSDHWAEAEQLVGEALIEHLLHSGWPGIPTRYELSVYIYDEARDILSPVYPASVRGLSIAEFKPGAGATGVAWNERDLVVVRDEAVSDPTYGLTPEQQRHFRSYRVVAGVPVTLDGEMIGVLTAIAREDDGFFDSPSGQKKLRVLAYGIGIVLEGMPVATVPSIQAPETEDDP